jgi:exopolysaccharide biosynthesis polyprenyl glycosylphosphotransferase
MKDVRRERPTPPRRARRPAAAASALRPLGAGALPAAASKAAAPAVAAAPVRTALPRLSLPLSDRRLVLAAVDLLALNGSLLLTLAVRSAYHVRATSAVHPAYWFLVLSALWLPIAAAFDVYEARSLGRPETGGSAVLRASLAASALYLMIPYVTPSLPGSRLALLLFPALAAVMTSGARALAGAIMARATVLRPTLVVGTGPAARTIAGVVCEAGGPAFRLLGFVGDYPRQHAAISTGRRSRSDREPPPAEWILPVLGHWKALPDLVSRLGVTTLVLAAADELDGELLQSLTDCLERGAEVIPMPALYEQLTGCVPVQYIEHTWYVAMPLDHPGTRGLYPLLKRCLDLVLASAGLLLLGALLPFLALLVRLDSPGPLFYRQRRVGKGGRLFTMYKLRSMVRDAEPDGAHWAEAHDPRVTRVGRFLRRTHLDEFPQLWNVLRGEMSAVGPRPERPEFVATLSREIPFYRIRHAVKPGMAGWGLVRQGYGASKEDALLKLQYDLYYIKHQSLWLDVVILLKTVLDTLTLRGR